MQCQRQHVDGEVTPCTNSQAAQLSLDSQEWRHGCIAACMYCRKNTETEDLFHAKRTVVKMGLDKAGLAKQSHHQIHSRNLGGPLKGHVLHND